MSASSKQDGAAWSSAAGSAWLWRFAAILFGGLLLIYLAVVVVDPYSTGYFTPFKRVDIAIGNRYFANAGRVRDPQFDAAILGNSHGTRFDTVTLNEATERRFVQLAIAGVTADEQLTLARAFVRAHPAGDLVLIWTIDHFWCKGGTRGQFGGKALPQWLYDGNRIAYLRNIFSLDALQATAHRAGILLFNTRPAGPADARPQGDGSPGAAAIARAAVNMRAKQRPAAAPEFNLNELPLTALADVLGSVKGRARNVFVFPANHISEIPLPNSGAERALNACKAEVASIAARHNGAVVDWMTDGTIARDMSNFWDGTHMKDPIARLMDRDIIAKLRGLPAK